MPYFMRVFNFFNLFILYKDAEGNYLYKTFFSDEVHSFKKR